MANPTHILGNLDAVRRRIADAAAKTGRVPEAICLVAVTKSVGIAEAQALYECGVRELGENRVREALRKQDALAALKIHWHMIGHLQTNKANKAVGKFVLIHSVDSLRLAHAINAAAERAGAADVLLQMNVSGEQTKSGFAPAELEPALEQIRSLQHLTVRGLMTMTPRLDDPEEARPLFSSLRKMRDRHRKSMPTLEHLSMGMTQDFDIAIEEGADMVRVGTALFREE